MRYNVTFRSSFPINREAHPKGEELARHIYDQLEELGVQSKGFDCYEDFAWVLWTEKPFVLLGHVGNPTLEWLIQIASKYGTLRRALGATDDKQRSIIAHHLDAVLHADPSIHDVRWHEGAFSDVGWAEHPE